MRAEGKIPQVQLGGRGGGDKREENSSVALSKAARVQGSCIKSWYRAGVLEVDLRKKTLVNTALT